MNDGQKRQLEMYLRDLEKAMGQIPVAERSDIILELNTHITETFEQGEKSLDEILRALGSPEQVANRYLLERGLEAIEIKKGPSLLKWGCLIVSAFCFLIILGFFLTFRSCVKQLSTSSKVEIHGNGPIVEVDEDDERVRVLGGLIDVDGKNDKINTC